MGALMLEFVAHYSDMLFNNIVWPSAKIYLLAVVLGTGIEFVAPGERHSLLSRARGAFIFVFYATLSFGLAAVAHKAAKEIGIKPLFNVDLSAFADSDNFLVSWASLILLPFALLIYIDFFYYWYHRAQHTFPVLWRIHRVHHSIEELNVTNSYNHFLEGFVYASLVTIPVTTLFNISVTQTAFSMFFLQFYGYFVHCDTQLRFGKFKYVLAEPRYHRLHHSVEERHWNKNFVVKFPIWDIIFGTAYFPAANEYHKTGASDMREPRNVMEWFLARNGSRSSQSVGANITAGSAPMDANNAIEAASSE